MHNLSTVRPLSLVETTMAYPSSRMASTRSWFVSVQLSLIIARRLSPKSHHAHVGRRDQMPIFALGNGRLRQFGQLKAAFNGSGEGVGTEHLK